MSQVKISGNASGTGILTVAAPNTNTDYTLTLPANTGTILTTASSGLGKVLQVVQTVKTDTFTTTSTSKVDITGMSVSITPTSASSKVLVIATINYGGDYYNYYCDLLRGSTALGVPASGNNPCTVCLTGISLNNSWLMYTGGITYLDSPATTSSTTYKLQIATQSPGYSFYLNRSQRNASQDAVCSSSITAMEIAA